MEKKCLNCLNFKQEDPNSTEGYCKFWEHDVNQNDYCVEFLDKRNEDI